MSEQGFWDRVPRIAGDIMQRDIVGEHFLIPISGHIANLQRLFAVNEVGAFVWERIDGNRTLGAIRDQLLDAFEVEAELLEADIRAFIQQLDEAELLAPPTRGAAPP